MRHMQHDEHRSGLIAAGYVLVYRAGYFNCCPGCGGSHWHVGRHTAECAYCATALPIAVNLAPPMADAPVRSGWRALLPV